MNYLSEIVHRSQWMDRVQNDLETLLKTASSSEGCTNVTDGQTDDRRICDSKYPTVM